MASATGRPSKYKPEFVEQAAKLCALGATDKDLADFFGVHVDTIDQWKSVHTDFSESLKESKAKADAKVERSLYERANGYSHKAVKIFMPASAVAPVYADYIEHYPPDTTACIFWLKNRRPDLWRDVNHLDVTKRTANDLTDDELAAVAAGKAIRKAKNAADA